MSWQRADTRRNKEWVTSVARVLEVSRRISRWPRPDDGSASAVWVVVVGAIEIETTLKKEVT